MLLVVCLVETRRLIRAPFRLGNLSGGCHCNGPNTPANTFLPKQCQRSEREMMNKPLSVFYLQRLE
jgi:hypothetical protein